MLSVILIVKNEAANITDCLQSVQWANEIIVLDSGSTDNTLALARAYTDKIISTDWQGYGIQKNRALDQATGQWVLSIDADERVSPALRADIIAAMQNPAYSAWQIPRLSTYCGREMRHGGWWPDHVLRLWQRGTARFSDDVVHEKVCLHTGKRGTLKNPLHHIAYQNLEQVLNKVNHYSSIGAEQALAKGKKGSLRSAIFHGLWAFIRCYIIRLGFLDGREGFMLAISNAEGTYYRYLKLMLLDSGK